MIELIDKMIELGVGTKKNDGDEQEGQNMVKMAIKILRVNI